MPLLASALPERQGLEPRELQVQLRPEPALPLLVLRGQLVLPDPA
ncbi:hypothetical protein GCM10009628_36530 [Paeniglutamicibacter kerguelensis]